MSLIIYCVICLFVFSSLLFVFLVFDVFLSFMCELNKFLVCICLIPDVLIHVRSAKLLPCRQDCLGSCCNARGITLRFCCFALWRHDQKRPVLSAKHPTKRKHQALEPWRFGEAPKKSESGYCMTMRDLFLIPLDVDTLEAYSRPDTNIDIEAEMFEWFLIVMCSHPKCQLGNLGRCPMRKQFQEKM